MPTDPRDDDRAAAPPDVQSPPLEMIAALAWLAWLGDAVHAIPAAPVPQPARPQPRGRRRSFLPPAR